MMMYSIEILEETTHSSGLRFRLSKVLVLLLHLEMRRARILINCLSSRDIGASLKEVLVKRSLETRIEAVQTRISPAVGHNYLIRLIRERPPSLSLSLSLADVRSPTRTHTNIVATCLWARREREIETKKIYVCTTDAGLLLTRVPMVRHSFPLCLAPSLLSLFSPCCTMCARALYGTQKRILTDWKPFTIDARPWRTSFLHSEVTRCTGRKDDSLACAFGLRDCTGHLEKPTSLMRITVYDADEKQKWLVKVGNSKRNRLGNWWITSKQPSFSSGYQTYSLKKRMT